MLQYYKTQAVNKSLDVNLIYLFLNKNDKIQSLKYNYNQLDNFIKSLIQN